MKSPEIAAFAADIWRRLPPSLRQQAGEHSYAWCIAMEVLYLMNTGDGVKAFRALEHCELSSRRVRRVIRRIHRCLMQDNSQPSLENGDTE